MSKADLGFLWLPLLTILVAIAMALGKLPLNRFYGFRTPKTLSSRTHLVSGKPSGWVGSCYSIGRGNRSLSDSEII
jgi:hypothetical protein